MARGGKKRGGLEEAGEPQPPSNAAAGDDGLTEMERQRAEIIARNRERLAALGIPILVSQLERTAGGAKKQKREKKAGTGAPAGEDRPPQAQKAAKGRGSKEEQPRRRSKRLQEAEEHPRPKPERAEERFERELGEFVVEGSCPRCGRQMDRGHRNHLNACTGPRAQREQRPASQREDALKGLCEEERRDKHKVLEARMKQLHLDGLVELSSEAAKFVVLGSKGNHYTVALKDDKHTCECMDYRFRRHNCKHICLVLCQLGIEDEPSEWRSAVDARLDELLERKREREALDAQTQPAPRAKGEEVALRLL